ncbi:RNA polymerase sigma factor [Pseudonocardia asaccharolytica]|uniref:RNA polymerase sigma factor 70 region 4 type 2 domain-containing protein n=1 Tax=Pseudonocardia asaccharolytica DSM 44247 = NBRC 16224 TaxID=1123024 RepID=A0A511D3Z1_9PSEU|nr:sigma factor-like helix-turn-helix DNA-binding protein [Pseudonocardia asaccharolytica]GEL19521.1 hypothetical protein PA7_33580 [Pseudonocardia asaccharolytica DSM 44247 = NBRC 16224]
MSALAQHRADSGDRESTVSDERDAAETAASGDAGAAETAAEPADVQPEASEPDAPEPDAAEPALAARDATGQGDFATPAELRADFGAHLEANYQRLVAQLYAITLNSGEAHEVVQDAYSQAWRDWGRISRSEDPTTWIRRVAVRSTMRSWRSVLARIGIGRSTGAGTEAADPRTAALLGALRRLSPAERRSVVLFHMVGVPMTEIAVLERVSLGTVQARLSRARQVAAEGLADVLSSEFGPYDDEDTS